ncbi:MAG: MFS transporter [Methylococcales bacterium]
MDLITKTAQKWKTPQNMLLAMVFVLSFCFGIWLVLLNNFVIEKAHFTGIEIGILQSLREIPGFLAFTAVFVLYLLREQTFALLSLGLMCIGIAVTGFFPNTTGLYITTVVMSVGFHYFETMNKSLTLQWLDKQETPHFLGRSMAVKAFASLSAYALIWICMDYFQIDYQWMYFVGGITGLVAVIYLWMLFPKFTQYTEQHKKLILRKQYWLYYALVFFGGARRQIFMVFAGFMMVEKFGYSVGNISLLFIINYVFNFLFAARIGKWIGYVGERKVLIIEYIGLIFIFSSYAFVTNANIAAGLYVLDHLFFAFAIAMTTYFQKIAQPKDIAATASVSFSINHIAAVVIPALLGILWVSSPKLVFLVGVAFAICSLILAFNIPKNPRQGNETLWPKSLKNSR